MIQAWQKRLLNNKPAVQYDFSEAGTHTQVLDAGIYDMWLVGAGGGGLLFNVSLPSDKMYADGGVGGVLHVRVAVQVQTAVTVNVGTGGESKINGPASGTYSAVAGGATTITGLANVTLSAGGGEPGTITFTSVTDNIRTPGAQGTNTASGKNVQKIFSNNAIKIVSQEGATSARSRDYAGQPNTNWAEDTTKGAGGQVGWTAPTRIVSNPGGVGFVRIKTAE